MEVFVLKDDKINNLLSEEVVTCVIDFQKNYRTNERLEGRVKCIENGFVTFIHIFWFVTYRENEDRKLTKISEEIKTREIMIPTVKVYSIEKIMPKPPYEQRSQICSPS